MKIHRTKVFMKAIRGQNLSHEEASVMQEYNYLRIQVKMAVILFQKILRQRLIN